MDRRRQGVLWLPTRPALRKPCRDPVDCSPPKEWSAARGLQRLNATGCLRVHQDGNHPRWHDFVQQPQALRLQIVDQNENPRGIATRPIEACDLPKLHGIHVAASGGFGHKGRCAASCGYDNGYLTPNEIASQFRQSIVATFGPTVLDRTFRARCTPPSFKALSKCSHWTRDRVRRYVAQKANHRQCRLLRARRERQCRRATEQRDEVAPSHSITSSAAACSVSGTVRPSALAVLRLITSSNVVGCSTGSADGLAPLRIRPA